MPYDLIEIAVSEKHPHPRLEGRVTGKVRVILRETMDGRDATHELFIPVWAQFAETRPEGDVDMALMLKAATIVARLKANLSRGEGV
ncbi:hypothetical protein [uncultured Devosia sp.]|uniref:hypothetical protein n=1 Tax=uncultured Devosia sp. TaxID=211434 RepID=UPI0035CBE93F